jgi:predicted RNA methylase
MDESELPPFLRNSDPLEPEDIPLQVALLTMELARMRADLAALRAALDSDCGSC